MIHVPIEKRLATKIELRIEDLVSRAIVESGKSDSDIASEVQEMLGGEYGFTSAFVNCYRERCYVEWLAVYDIPFCVVTGDWSLMRHRLRLAGLTVRNLRKNVTRKFGAAAYRKEAAQAPKAEKKGTKYCCPRCPFETVLRVSLSRHVENIHAIRDLQFAEDFTPVGETA